MCVCRTLSIRITSSAFVDVESLNTYTSPAPRKMRRRVLHLCLLCTDTHCERVQSACACIAVSRGGGPLLALRTRGDSSGEFDAVSITDERALEGDEEVEATEEDEADDVEEAESDRDRGDDLADAGPSVLTGRDTVSTRRGNEEESAQELRSWRALLKSSRGEVSDDL